MQPPRRFLPYIGVLIPGVGWMYPVFTQLYKKYPCLGSVLVYGLTLGALLGIACSVWFFVTGGHQGRARRNIVANYITIGVTAFATGIVWAPCINALLDSGPETTVAGTIKLIDNPGKGNPSRRVTAIVDGVERTGTFDPYEHFWNVAAVRNGGPVQLTVRPGFLGVPWIAKFSDP